MATVTSTRDIRLVLPQPSSRAVSERPPRPPLVIGAVALMMSFPACLITIGTAAGPGVSPDSTSYVSAAESFAEFGHLTTWTGEPISLFPPGFPLILGMLIDSGFGPEPASAVIGASCAGLLVLLTYLIGREAMNSRAAGLASAAVVAASAAVPQVFTWILSEPLFSVTVAAVVYALTRAITRGRMGLLLIALISGSISLATTIRFAGVFLIPVAAAAALMTHGRVDTSRRSVARAAAVALLSPVGFIVVAVRNLLIGSEPFGERFPGGRTVGAIVDESLTTLAGYVSPTLEGRTASIVGLLVIVLFVTGVRHALRSADLRLFPVFGTVTVYWGFLAWSEWTSPIDPVNVRLTIPALTPMAVGAVYSLAQILRRIALIVSPREIALRLPSIAAIACLLSYIGFNASSGIDLAAHLSTNSQGFNRQQALSSPLAHSLSDPVCRSGVASANPWLAYWVSRCAPIMPIPLASKNAAQQGERAELESALRAGRVRYLAFFDDRRSIKPRDLRDSGFDIRLAVRFTDGNLYEVVP
jgi:hypothetical protein